VLLYVLGPWVWLVPAAAAAAAAWAPDLVWQQTEKTIAMYKKTDNRNTN